MKAVILAGGQGTRLAEETDRIPKPLVQIGGKPILWHIMKIYSAHGINDFIICLGYKGYAIKEYFNNYYIHNSDVTFDFTNNKTIIHQNHVEPWHVTLVDTGDKTLTGGRLKRVQEHVGDEDFCFTYGDGVGDIDISAALAFHKAQNRLATVTVTKPPGRFGAIQVDGGRVSRFQEKPEGEGWINGGFFILSPKVIDFIEDDQTIWEDKPMQRLADEGQLSAWVHHGFWHPMDTLRDRILLEQLWENDEAPWRIW